MRASIITIGNFDGVHIGHRAIIERSRQLGDECELPVVVLTFEPHPASVLRPDSHPRKLTDLSRKITLLRSAGADEVIVLEPTSELLSLTPELFLQKIVDQHRPAALVEGNDFRFGQNRLGDIHALGAIGKQMGFDVHVVDPVTVQLHDQLLATASSSLVRWLLNHGRVEDASRCLERPYGLTGAVVRGRQRGRTMSVPTINLDPAATEGRVVPANGVYLGWVWVDRDTAYPAAISVGNQATFGSADRVIEAHLLGFDGDLYDQSVQVTFVSWLRDQLVFPDSNHLLGQLKRDIAQARCWQQSIEADGAPEIGRNLAFN